MEIIDILKKKRDGETLTKEEINFFIERYTAGIVPDYQASALLMAIYLKGMTEEETANLANEMLHSGSVLDLSDIPGIKVDKHSTGGVGDKISLALAPLVASAGVKNPMVSGRGLGHTGGTLDKLEAIPGFNVNLTTEEFIDQVNSVGTAIISATDDIAPADKKIYALRDTTATVESLPLIASSIMSKKLASGTDALVFDVKTGSGAFMSDFNDARSLARELLNIAKNSGKKAVALITNMNQPLGQKVGNTLEVEEAIDILKGKGPKDTTELTLTLGAYMLILAGLSDDVELAKEILKQRIADGSALAKFSELITAQGGNAKVITDYSLLPHAKNHYEVRAKTAGIIQKIDANKLGMLNVYLGGGRLQKTDTIDFGVGLILNKRVGEQVAENELLLTIEANEGDADALIKTALDAYEFGGEPVAAEDLIYEIMEE